MPFRFVASLLLLFSSGCLADIDGCSDGNTCQLRAPEYSGDIKIFCVKAPGLTEPFGIAARDALRTNVRGTVRVLMDRLEGRLPVAELIRDDGLNLGLELVQRGLAKVPKECNEVIYRLAETEALKASLGLWAVPPGSEVE
jgi:endonuclease YncB( thermonuclease family)